MKKWLLALAAVLALNLPVLALAGTNGDFKTLGPKILKSPKNSSSLKSSKDDVTIVYGGEDISRKISDNSFTA